MDGHQASLSVSSDRLYAHLGTAFAPLLVGVHRADAFDADDRLIAGAIRRDLAALLRRKISNPLLIAVTAAVGLIAYPILQPAWVMVR